MRIFLAAIVVIIGANIGITAINSFTKIKMPNSNDSANLSPKDTDTTKPAKTTDKELSPYLQDVINNEKVVRTPRGPLSD